jgi:hypothetical protein
MGKDKLYKEGAKKVPLSQRGIQGDFSVCYQGNTNDF